MFVSTQEKGSKRTKVNDYNWNALVRTKKRVWSRPKREYVGWATRYVTDGMVKSCGIDVSILIEF